MPKLPRLKDFTVAWICPLPVETTAALFMFDEDYDQVHDLERQKGQHAQYHFGKICGHNVVVVGFPAAEVGIAVSGTIAAEIRRDIPNLDVAFLVGIGGGLPSATRDIRLGDVAIAVPGKDHSGVVDYSLNSVRNGEISLKQWQNATDPLLRSTISWIDAHAGKHGDSFARHLEIYYSNKKGERFRRPGPPLPPPGSPFESVKRDTGDTPIPHYGCILSGNSVIKDAKVRDELRDKYGAICIEMEAAGMMNRIPVAVIRGISDFADSSKNDNWHGYASATAAAYAKEMLRILSPLRESVDPDLSKTRLRLNQVLPSEWAFFGREEELKQIEEVLGMKREHPQQKSVFALWGLIGTGKTQLASMYVRKQQQKNPERMIFWMKGESKEDFERSVLHMFAAEDQAASELGMEPPTKTDERRDEVIDSFLKYLNRPGNDEWLLVICNVASQQATDQGFDIHSYIAQLVHGSVLLTTAHLENVTNYKTLQIRGLEVEDGLALLKARVLHKSSDEGRGLYKVLVFHKTNGFKADMRELVRLLKGQPLALRVAITTINKHGLKVGEYVDRWKQRDIDNGMMGDSSTLYLTLDVGFEDLRSANPTAANLLTLFGFLDHTDFWLGLCSSAHSSDYPEWLRSLAHNKSLFQEIITSLVAVAFIEVKNDGTRAASYEIHPAVHAYTRFRCNSEAKEYFRWAMALVAANVPRTDDVRYWEKAQRLAPHADQCIIHTRRGVERRLSLANLERIGSLFRLLGRYKDAITIYKFVLHLLEHDTSQDATTKEMIADIHGNLGLVFNGQRSFNKAIDEFRKSYEIRSRLPEYDRESRTISLYNIGRSYMMLGDREKAEKSFRQVEMYLAEAIRDNRASREILTQFCRVSADLGEIDLEWGNVRRARERLEKTIEYQSQQLGEFHTETLSTKLSLGKAYVKLTLFRQACEVLKGVMLKYTEYWGEFHNDTIRAGHEFAVACMECGQQKRNYDGSGDEQFQIAEKLLVQAMGFYEDQGNSRFDQFLVATLNYGILQSVTGRLNDAESSIQFVLNQRKERFSASNADTLAAQIELSLIFQKQQRFQESERHFSEVTTLCKSLRRPTIPGLLQRTMYLQGELYLAWTGHNEYAERLFKEVAQTEYEGEENEWQRKAQRQLLNISISRGR